MGRAESFIVSFQWHSDDVDLTHQGWQLCNGSSLAKPDKAFQHCCVCRPASSPLLMRMQEGDEVQIAAAQLVDQPSQKRPDALLIHICQCSAEVAVVPISNTLGCLQQCETLSQAAGR